MPRDASPERVLVIGEALVDVVSSVVEPVETALPGGSPLNVAVGLQRLGIPTTLHSAFGADPHGVAIAQHLEESGVTVTPGTVSDRETSIAQATIAPDGTATYSFSIAWDPGPVDTSGFTLVHTGSIGAALEPGASEVERLLAATGAVVSYDPNVRPALMGDHAAALARVERLVALADVVKASDEDIAWLYPDAAVAQILEHWLALGPRLVVVTRGGDGADALTDAGPVHVDAAATTVVDTIGAGDSFTAGLLAALLTSGFDDVAGALRFAARCAGITVSRPGADPPTADELADDA
jgi:fructokinase